MSNETINDGIIIDDFLQPLREMAEEISSNEEKNKAD